MRRVLPVLVFLLAPVTAPAEEGWTVAVSGEVEAGEDFIAALPSGLVFTLEATRQAPPMRPTTFLRNGRQSTKASSIRAGTR